MAYESLPVATRVKAQIVGTTPHQLSKYTRTMYISPNKGRL